MIFTFPAVIPAEARPLYSGERFSLDLKGYFKDLSFTSEGMATGEPYVAHLDRFRTEWEARFGSHLSAKVIWDHELILGDYVGTQEFAAQEAMRNAPFLDMDYAIVQRADFFYGQSLYRATARFDSEAVVVTAGRQKVDWGVMRLIAPTDLFSPISFFGVEREERVGAPAVNLVVPIGSSLRVNPVYVLSDDFDRSRTALRITQTLGHFDASLLGGRFLRDVVVGADLAGDIRQMGVRGEFLFDRAAEGSDFIQLAAGVDYGFENSLILAFEYFFNSQGTNDLLTAQPFPGTAPFLKTVHENFLGARASYDLTPLWKIQTVLLADLNGTSFFINPESRYSLFEWMELAGGAQFFTGRADGEFTARAHLYYLQTQLFF